MSRTNNNTRWFPAPPVCTAFWTEGDWLRWEERHGVWKNPKGFFEPEGLEALGETWIATGERTEHGETLYRRKT